MYNLFCVSSVHSIQLIDSGYIRHFGMGAAAQLETSKDQGKFREREPRGTDMDGVWTDP